MFRKDCLGVLVLLVCAAVASGEGVRAGRPSLDLAEVSGAAPDTCFDCMDMQCPQCPRPRKCVHVLGYCYETVRNLSQFCVARTHGQWENCKWRVDPAGACVTSLFNPCTPEHVICVTPVSSCGPLGTCIPEGVCTH